MKLVDSVHRAYVHTRRVRILSEQLAPLFPLGSRVLDVGCGDGILASALMELRPDLALEGIDVLVRDGAKIAVREFNGLHIPFPDKSFDIVLLVDVIHHADDGRGLLAEASRVARQGVVVKDHLNDAWLAQSTLAFMDRVGNARHGVALPFHYWGKRTWDEVIQAVGLKTTTWIGRLGIYPWWADWVFGRSLHFIGFFEPVRI
jgi:SAM-dependent methyltransferase